MADVRNAIWVGYAFEQQFTLDEGVVPDGAGIRATVHFDRRNGAGRGKIDIVFDNPEPLLWTIQLSADETKQMTPGEALLDPVITSTPEQIMGVRFTIAVLRPLTAPAS